MRILKRMKELSNIDQIHYLAMGLRLMIQSKNLALMDPQISRGNSSSVKHKMSKEDFSFWKTLFQYYRELKESELDSWSTAELSYFQKHSVERIPDID
jgi:hypothetical protein